LGAAFSFALAWAGCGDDDESEGGSREPTAGSTGSQLGEVYWSYEGDRGTARWGSLADDFAVCAEGVEQSPVDIQTSGLERGDLPAPRLDWRAADMEAANNGHTIQVNVPEGSSTQFDGETYQLVQFHWHRPSEHTFDGRSFAMELHFVHRAESGVLAVLAVLLEDGPEDTLYDVLFTEQPREGETRTLVSFDPLRLLPDDLTAYAYPGSLTTPPCSEGVSWYVLRQPRAISGEQAGRFLYDGNARPVQPLNDRQIRVSGD
jgi:carbonic anhydrase